MREYKVMRTNGVPDWSTVEKLPVDICPWGGEYRPEVFAQAVYAAGEGFYIRMTCKESDPLAVYTQPDEMVCRDSCLEFFIDPVPGAGIGYINIEANSLGTSLIGLGEGRHDRKPVRSMGCDVPTVEAFREGEYWGWQGFLSLTTIRQIYGKETFATGDILRANFYKCGDRTAVEHYIVWNRVLAPQPDYHRLECFGKLVIG